MRSNSQNIQQLIEKISQIRQSQIANRKSQIHILGIESKQWLACVMICAMLLPVFALPVGGSVRYSSQTHNDQFEPVNEDLPIWTEAWRNLNAKIEAWATPLRAENALFNGGDDDEKKKKKDKKDIKTEEKDNNPNDEKLSETEKSSIVKNLPTDEKSNDLAKKVKAIETQIADKTEIGVGQILSLAALPLDKKGNVVNGLALQWKSSDPKILKILNDSQAIGLKAGEATLTVFAGKLKRELTLKVTDKPATDTTSANQTQILTPDPPVITEQQAESMLSPDNNLGNPAGQTEMSSLTSAAATRTGERAGSANYSFGLSAAFLPGRGMDAEVGIGYNSRVWNKTEFGTTKIFDFNIDQNWLAPGFDIGLGDLMPYTSSTGNAWILTSPGGTRHQLAFKQYVTGGCALYESTDGTFIQTTICQITSQNHQVNFADGTKVTYSGHGNYGGWFPTTITDRNGNMLTVAYLQGDMVGKIAYIRDTLNRYITFHYDNTTEKKLVAISVPGYDNSSTPRQTIRFYYEDLTLQWQNRFENTAQVNAPTTPIKVLKYVYFPGTQTGFRYDYSPYFGMIYKITQLRGMSVSTDSLTDTGMVTNEGNWAAWTHYNYPATATELPPPLADVPKYSWRKDDWQGRTTAIPQTNFISEEQVTITNGNRVGTRTTTITAPDGTRSISVSKINQTVWDDGLLTETRLATIENSQERVWSKTKLYWQQGNDLPQGRDNPRVQKVETTNDAGQTRATSFEYDGYNNQTVAREHDFAAENVLGTELRRTETTFETDAGWINNRLLRLPKTVKTIVNNATVAKMIYEYDNNGQSAVSNLTLRPDIDTSTHNIAYNPSFPSETYCIPGCTQSYCCHWIQRYNPSTDFRGNVTKVTAFSNATLETDANAVVTTIKYDIAGNAVEAGLNCCKKRSWEYVKANEYAYPMSEASGIAGELTTSATYDRNTGLVKTATDENLQTTTLTYNPNNLRFIRTDSPNGAWQTTEYNDTSYPYFVKSTTSLDASRSVSSWSFADGRGLAFRSRSQTVGGYLSGDVEFDIMGRPIKSYSPYTITNLTDERPAGIKFNEIIQRDGLGRTLQTKLTDDTTVSATYNGLVTTMTDQAGKKRRQTADALGNVVRVDEPDANGNLDSGGVPFQPTFYEYDGNDNLSKVTQTGNGATQERLFKYDSLSRLTHERQVEAMATLNDLGVKVTSGGLWTKVLKYNTDGLLIEGVEARGVKTTFGYDTLNRVSSVTFSDETGYQTPNIYYTYDEARAGFYNKGRLTKVRTEAVSGTQNTPATEQIYDFDKVGQVVKHQQKIDNQNYLLEYGYNLAGQLISEKYPSGKIVNLTVDNFGVLQTVSDAQRTYLNGITINNQGLLSQMNFGNATNQTFSYNDRFQMTSQSLLKGAEVLQKYDYSYGQVDLATGNVDLTKNNGQLGKIESFIGTEKQWSQRFGYDELGRLSEAREYKSGDNAQLSYKQKFDFDRFGNLYRKAANNPMTGQQNPLTFTPIEEADIDKTTNRFTSQTGTIYNDAGQVVTDNKFRLMNFSYDANGRMIKASKANVPDALSVYDALGNRVATKVNDVWQFMIYDAFGKLIAEYGGLTPSDEGGVKYVLSDWQGSVRAVLNNAGFIQSRTDYQAFGEEIQAGVGLRTPAQSYGVSNQTRQGYGLTEKDDSTGLNHTWFRKNENRAGRWTSPDPYNGSMNLGNPQSFNRYSYVENEPTNFIDPSGLVILIATTSCGYQWEDINNGETVTGRWVWSCSTATIFLPSLGFGNGGGGGGGSPPKSNSKKKCKQDKKGGDKKDIISKLDKAGLLEFIDQKSIQVSKEGITFTIDNREGFLAALNANNNFRHNTPFGAAHAGTVGANIFTVQDFRSFTSGSDTLGADSTGFIRSLQIDVGPGIIDPTNRNGPQRALGYADLDCDNPAQDVRSFFRHAFKVIFGR